MSEDNRHRIIWQTNAEVGAMGGLSNAARQSVFWTALEDRLPDVTEAEVARAMGILEGMRA